MSRFQNSYYLFTAYLEKYVDRYYEFIYFVDDNNNIVNNIDVENMQLYGLETFYIRDIFEEGMNQEYNDNMPLKVNAYYIIEAKMNPIESGLQLNLNSHKRLYDLLSLNKEHEWFLNLSMHYELIERTSEILVREKKLLDKSTSLKKKLIEVLINGFNVNKESAMNYHSKRFNKWQIKNVNVKKTFTGFLNNYEMITSNNDSQNLEEGLLALIRSVIPYFKFFNNDPKNESEFNERAEQLESIRNLLKQVIEFTFFENERRLDGTGSHRRLFNSLNKFYEDYDLRIDSLSKLLNILNPQCFPIYNRSFYLLLEYLEFNLEGEENYIRRRKSKTYIQYISYVNAINEIIRSFEDYSMNNQLNYEAFNYYQMNLLNYFDI